MKLFLCKEELSRNLTFLQFVFENVIIGLPPSSCTDGMVLNWEESRSLVGLRVWLGLLESLATDDCLKTALYLIRICSTFFSTIEI